VLSAAYNCFSRLRATRDLELAGGDRLVVRQREPGATRVRCAAQGNAESARRAAAGTNRGTTPSPETTASTLADYGITKDQSAAWQWLADVPDGSA
jgi:hypothetical protein